jgi:hypothetical protein
LKKGENMFEELDLKVDDAALLESSEVALTLVPGCLTTRTCSKVIEKTKCVTG